MAPMRGAVWLLGLMACDRAFGLAPVSSTGLPGFPYRKRVALTQPAVATLTDFPVSIALDADPDLAAHAHASGEIAFTAGDGITPLAQDLAAYDPTTGALDAWVRIPALPPGETVVYVYYGGTGPKADAAAVWSAHFAGAWHMSDAGAIDHDRTGHGHDVGATTVAEQPGTTGGVAGAARRFDGVDDQLVSVGGDTSLEVGMGSFAYGVWVNPSASVGDYDMPFHDGGSSVPTPGYDLELGNAAWAASLSDGTQTVQLPLGDAVVGTWSFIVVNVDRAAHLGRTYLNGAFKDDTDITSFGSLSPMEPLVLGGPRQFAGAVDEVRVYNAAVDEIWVATEYANLATRSAFVSVGDEEAL